MLNITNRAKNVSPSLTLAITAKANKLKENGVDIVSFAAGEPDFNTPEFIVNAAKDALDKGLTKYTPASGITPLKKSVCAKLKRDNGLDYQPEQIVISTGAKQSLFNALQTVCQEGDEVIIISPYWLTYPELIKICGAKPVVVETKAEEGFALDVDRIEKAVSDKTRALIVNMPNNPSGTVYSKEKIEELAAMLRRHPDVWIIADEIYEALTYDGLSHFSIAQIADMKDRTILINGMSKSYAMTGWRIGYAASPAAVAKYMGALQSHQTSNPNTIAQYASVTALDEGDAFIKNMRTVFEERRNALWSCLETVPSIKYVKGNGAFYVMVDISALLGKKYRGEAIDSALKFSELLTEHAHVSTIPCECFGIEGYIRLTYTLSIERIREGVERIKTFIEEIK
ncbi:MAG: pyridoxal phosphate-dependent aminotransferase [Christensenellales bacterium]